jgi:hypothetical protein
VKKSDFELDIGFSGSLGSGANDTQARRGMPELGTLVEFGPRGEVVQPSWSSELMKDYW